ncbi:hypothetical protein BDK51DRAFT_45071 [Blyttiomyces helicus]|uniref:Uncharacterized protein n=1 Tax=Blyttiomyces helicus TaxID=388810 RepID=A0A4P9VY32_9FUNG|nr:hypothetical protein BDK51DRAFT_45071 [Blyttiomyces helicus]|eukprot:RKO84162.1 hypothetical protein BDK51DRAFT_45071 [Blyttiomyces helicus]
MPASRRVQALERYIADPYPRHPHLPLRFLYVSPAPGEWPNDPVDGVEDLGGDWPPPGQYQYDMPFVRLRFTVYERPGGANEQKATFRWSETGDVVVATDEVLGTAAHVMGLARRIQDLRRKFGVHLDEDWNHMPYFDWVAMRADWDLDWATDWLEGGTVEAKDVQVAARAHVGLWADPLARQVDDDGAGLELSLSARELLRSLGGRGLGLQVASAGGVRHCRGARSCDHLASVAVCVGIEQPAEWTIDWGDNETNPLSQTLSFQRQLYCPPLPVTFTLHSSHLPLPPRRLFLFSLRPLSAGVQACMLPPFSPASHHPPWPADDPCRCFPTLSAVPTSGFTSTRKRMKGLDLSDSRWKQTLLTLAASSALPRLDPTLLPSVTTVAASALAPPRSQTPAAVLPTPPTP